MQHWNEDDEAAVTRVLAGYYRAFSTLDAKAIVPYFHEPSVLISPLGVAAVPTSAALVPTFAAIMDDFRARGYGWSELTMLQVKGLSATAALASGVAIRYKTNGQELDRAGVTYVLHKAGNDCKIVVTLIHDAGQQSIA